MTSTFFCNLISLYVILGKGWYNRKDVYMVIVQVREVQFIVKMDTECICG